MLLSKKQSCECSENSRAHGNGSGFPTVAIFLIADYTRSSQQFLPKKEQASSNHRTLAPLFPFQKLQLRADGALRIVSFRSEPDAAEDVPTLPLFIFACSLLLTAMSSASTV